MRVIESSVHDGTVKCWGWSSCLGLGDSSNVALGTPTTVTALGTNASSIHVGVSATCAILKDATVQCTGDNNAHALGILDSGVVDHDVQAVTMLGTDASSLQIGRGHGCALLNDATMDATLKCWGQNEDGVFGSIYPWVDLHSERQGHVVSLLTYMYMYPYQKF